VSNNTKISDIIYFFHNLTFYNQYANLFSAVPQGLAALRDVQKKR